LAVDSSLFPSLSGLFEFGVPRDKDGRFFAGEFVRRGDVANRAVQADGVVVLHPLADCNASDEIGKTGLG